MEALLIDTARRHLDVWLVSVTRVGDPEDRQVVFRAVAQIMDLAWIAGTPHPVPRELGTYGPLDLDATGAVVHLPVFTSLRGYTARTSAGRVQVTVGRRPQIPLWRGTDAQGHARMPPADPAPAWLLVGIGGFPWAQAVRPLRAPQVLVGLDGREDGVDIRHQDLATRWQSNPQVTAAWWRAAEWEWEMRGAPGILIREGQSDWAEGWVLTAPAWAGEALAACLPEEHQQRDWPGVVAPPAEDAEVMT